MITPANERDVLMIDERDRMEAEHAAAIEAALVAQLAIIISDEMSDAEIASAPARVDENSDELEAAIVALLLASLAIGIRSGQAQLAPAAIGVDVGEVTVSGLEMARQRARQALMVINATTRRGIADAVREWLRQAGRDIRALRDEVAALFSRQRAEAIAQTEGTFGFREGVAAVALAIGVTQLEWYTMQDERVCPICAPMHGKRRSVNGRYESGMSGPPAHPYCRCGEAIVLMGVGNG